MKTAFRRKTKGEFARLLEYWGTIEGGIKKAELVHGAAIIPAINELRYASRQLYTAISIYGKKNLQEEDIAAIERKLMIAEQYLLNSDHDTVDGIVGFYAKAIRRINSLYGLPEITIHFPEYPFLCKKIEECESLIQETRDDYNKRRINYDRMRLEHFKYLSESYKNVEKAEVNAEYNKRKLERELIIKQGTINILTWISVIASALTIAGFGLALYVFIYHTA